MSEVEKVLVSLEAIGTIPSQSLTQAQLQSPDFTVVVNRGQVFVVSCVSEAERIVVGVDLTTKTIKTITTITQLEFAPIPSKQTPRKVRTVCAGSRIVQANTSTLTNLVRQVTAQLCAQFSLDVHCQLVSVQANHYSGEVSVQDKAAIATDGPFLFDSSTGGGLIRDTSIRFNQCLPYQIQPQTQFEGDRVLIPPGSILTYQLTSSFVGLGTRVYKSESTINVGETPIELSL